MPAGLTATVQSSAIPGEALIAAGRQTIGWSTRGVHQMVLAGDQASHARIPPTADLLKATTTLRRGPHRKGAGPARASAPTVLVSAVNHAAPHPRNQLLRCDRLAQVVEHVPFEISLLLGFEGRDAETVIAAG